jgi:hypothetical protein
MRKKKNFEKENIPLWSKITYTVEKITEGINEQPFFHVTGKR